jgi:hypothetical protein
MRLSGPVGQAGGFYVPCSRVTELRILRLKRWQDAIPNVKHIVRTTVERMPRLLRSNLKSDV